MDIPDSPLLRGLMEFGVACAKEEVRDRFERLEGEPLGFLVRAAIAEHKRIEAEGREVTADDISAFAARVRPIVNEARRRKGQGGAGSR